MGARIGCSSAHGSGMQNCEEGAWGECQLTVCADGLLLVDNACVLGNCEEGRVRACQVENGTGTQTCSANDWATCVPTKCNAGFHLDIFVCSPDAVTSAGTSASTSTKTGTVTTMNEEVQPKAQEKVAGVGEKSDGGQTSSLVDAKNVSQLGGDHAATIAAHFCAEGANTALEDPELSANDIAACAKNFQSAEKMNELAGRKSFNADPDVLANEKSKSTLETFEKNFGISSDEYLKRMLGGGNFKATLSELTSAKLSPEHFDQAFASADGLGAPSELTWGGMQANKPSLNNARDKLRQKMVAKEALPRRIPASSEISVSSAKDTLPHKDHLEPLRKEDLLGYADEKEQELSIFDVFRRKYQDLSRNARFR